MTVLRTAVGILAMAASMIATPACVSVPPEAAALSSELGERLDELERSQVAMLHQLMDERRARVDEFIEREWIPEFSANLLDDPAVERLLRIAGDEEEEADERVRAITLMGTRVQQRINEKRTSMVGALDELERELERRLRAEYAVAAQMNTAVTSFLVSASEAAELRERYLARFGIRDEEVREAIAESERVSARLRDTAESADQRAESFLERVEELRDRLQERRE